MVHKIAAGLLLASLAFAAEYTVDKKQDNLVKFTSEAPVEKIVGTTSKIDGYVVLDEASESPSGEFYFEVDLASLDTGIGLRNRHMRDNYLETKKYPFATYGGKIVQAEATDDGFNVVTRGVFDLHGVKKEMEISGAVTRVDGGWRAVSNFTVALADHTIERPQLMLLKIGETIEVEVIVNVKK